MIKNLRGPHRNTLTNWPPATSSVDSILDCWIALQDFSPEPMQVLHTIVVSVNIAVGYIIVMQLQEL